MSLDLHDHPVRSDDSTAKVDDCCQWIRKRDVPLDGFDLTARHRFDAESNYPIRGCPRWRRRGAARS